MAALLTSSAAARVTGAWPRVYATWRTCHENHWLQIICAIKSVHSPHNRSRNVRELHVA